MKVLVIGGTGLISVGVVKALCARGAEVVVYNRGRTPDRLPGGVQRLCGDRDDAAAFARSFATAQFDVVIDMICYGPDDAETTARVFGGRSTQLVFCSTVCTYGVEVPSSVLIDERFAQRPISPYGRAKLASEQVFTRAARDGAFALTILRPSHTYGPGGSLIDQLEPDGVAWDRIARGLPVLCAGDGLGLWQPTHRDDVGALFAQVALSPETYGEAYNATGDEVMTWRAYHATVARALGTRAKLVYAPAGWLLTRLPERLGLLAEITRFHGAYTSAKARAQVPGFAPRIGFEQGARETLEDVRRRGAWRESDAAYERVVEEALDLGFETDEL
jgi:nucleoside-diphosphate-sugar epimerase